MSQIGTRQGYKLIETDSNNDKSSLEPNVSLTLTKQENIIKRVNPMNYLNLWKHF